MNRHRKRFLVVLCKKRKNKVMTFQAKALHDYCYRRQEWLANDFPSSLSEYLPSAHLTGYISLLCIFSEHMIPGVFDFTSHLTVMKSFCSKRFCKLFSRFLVEYRS